MNKSSNDTVVTPNTNQNRYM